MGSSTVDANDNIVYIPVNLIHYIRKDHNVTPQEGLVYFIELIIINYNGESKRFVLNKSGNKEEIDKMWNKFEKGG